PFCLTPNRVALNLDTSAPNSMALNVRWHADLVSHPPWHGIQRQLTWR
ncbi:Os01g0111300, partial [Oryza sativa Japonica Group]